MNDLESLAAKLRTFRDERDWIRFHSPKNLSMALASEVGELLAELRWLTEAESLDLAEGASDARQAVTEEIADVTLFLVMLADRLNVDLIAAAEAKLAKNMGRFPASDGSASSATGSGEIS